MKAYPYYRIRIDCDPREMAWSLIQRFPLTPRFVRSLVEYQLSFVVLQKTHDYWIEVEAVLDAAGVN